MNDEIKEKIMSLQDAFSTREQGEKPLSTSTSRFLIFDKSYWKH